VLDAKHARFVSSSGSIDSSSSSEAEDEDWDDTTNEGGFISHARPGHGANTNRKMRIMIVPCALHLVMTKTDYKHNQ